MHLYFLKSKQNLELGILALGPMLAFGMAGCGEGSGSEPSEAQMKEAMEYAMNHPPGETVSDPWRSSFSKKKLATSPRRKDSDAPSM